MGTRRSASVGALPLEKKHFVSRNESVSGVTLDVRCACQYFQSDSLLPERINPVDSRPGSKLDFHHDPMSVQPGFGDHMSPGPVQMPPQMAFAPMQSMTGDRRLLAGDRNAPPDPERISMRSVGKHRSWDQASGSVDISFVEKYPELEETAKTRGLVVRSISDDDPHQMPGGMMPRQRFTSVDCMSAHKDPETLSMHSVRSLRRISRSPSKGDLFVADININLPPRPRYEQQRSRSVSRRTSNVDLSRGMSPHINVIAATPIPMQGPPPSFSRQLTPLRSPSPPTATALGEGDVDFRIAKRPLSSDYMRPDTSRESRGYVPNYPGEVLPQNRPIDMSKYRTSPEASTIVEQPRQLNQINNSTTRPTDPLEQTVAELESIAARHNVQDVVDNIKIERMSPPLVEDVPKIPINVDEQTRIDINMNVEMVDIDALIHEEEEKARGRARSKSAEREMRRSRSRSPAPRPISRAKSMSPPRQQDSLQVPQQTSYHQLKRGHSPERESSPANLKKMASEDLINHTAEDASKPSYSTRFKSMFSSKPKEDLAMSDPVYAQRERSPSPAPSALRMPSIFSKDKQGSSQRERSPSPAPSAFRMPSLFSKDKNGTQRERSPSPAPSGFRMPSMFSKDKNGNGKTHEKSPSPVRGKARLMSVFSKEQSMAATAIISGTNAAITNKPEAQAMSVKVHETFSLKVDEMDQYMAKPAKPPAGRASSLSKAPSIAKSIGSGEEFLESEHLSLETGEPFAPVIIGRSASTQFSMDHTNLPSEMSSQDQVSRTWSKEPSIHHHPEGGGKPLFSASIMLDSSGSLGPNSVQDRRAYIRGLRSPSEQRPMQQQQNRNFLDGRTQSQDRQQLSGSQDNLSTARMSKTVSFHFDERKSRLGDFESSALGKQQLQKREYLDKTYFSRDHEYEPIGAPSTEDKSSELKELHPTQSLTTAESNVDQMKRAEEMQKEIEDQFFRPTSKKPTPQTEIDVDINLDAQVDEPTDDLPKTAEKKGFMATAQERTRKMQIGLKTQAGKLKTKLKPAAKKPPSGSPKAKDRRMFKAPEFSKLKMPELKRPDMSKFKDFKRPEFTKFNKMHMSKFKLPEMSGMKLGRSKSFKEPDSVQGMEEDVSGETDVRKSFETTSPQKKLFDFNFGTFPRAQRRKNKPAEPESSFGTGTATEATSVIPSTETQPSMESSSSPKGDRGPGPVRSRWADKFSDVSYNDSEGSRYRRYGSELESFDRESSLERRMRDDLEDNVSEEPSMGILGAVTEDRQFAEFDEENRAIHEISNLRSGEFRRRPMVHQDSDLRSEDSKDAVGWTDREIQKNTLLRKAELEAEASYAQYKTTGEAGRQDTLSTASSGKKVVLEEIGEDEFFLRKRGISQDNIEINQYIRNAFRDGYDKPINSLEHVGRTSDYGDYDVPPPKPRRMHKHYQPDVSQEFESYGDDFSVSQNGSDFFGAPRRPMRKNRSRSKFSMDSQEVKYMDEEYLRDPSRESGVWNDLNVAGKENIPVRHEHSLHGDEDDVMRPQPPRRQKRRRDNSMDKDSYINGFGGRSVSNSYLQPTEDVIVYRTEHEYHHVPIATPEKYSESVSTHKSGSHYDLDDRISRGAISLEQNEQQQLQHVDEADRYVIDMMENDGYAVVRKEQIPKPTPPVRRKRFTHSPVDRYATMPNMRTKHGTPPPDRPPPPKGYTPTSDIFMTTTAHKSALSLDARPTYEEDDYEEPAIPERNNLQSGEVINKMKYRPLPPPPRPPREKRNRSFSKDSNNLQIQGSDEVDVVDGMQEEDEELGSHFEEVEASTQTDPLPDDFVCEEFEITDDMKIIEPRIRSQTIEDMLKEELEKELGNINHQVIDGDELAKGLQRFRESNQRSLSERSRVSSQGDRSKSQSRPQTPSAIIVERHSATPIQRDNESMVEASLVVRPIDDLELEEEELRREGLLTDGSQPSLVEMKEEEEEYIPLTVSEHSFDPSSVELGNLASDQETQQTDEEVERTLQRYRDELDEIGRQLMEQETTSQEPSPSASREEIRVSDREEQPIEQKTEWHSRAKRSLLEPQELRESDREAASDREEAFEISKEDLREPWQLSDIEEMRSDLEEQHSEQEEVPPTPRNEIEEAVTALEEYHVEIPSEDKPLPPPRRKSTTAIEPPLPPQPLAEDEPAVENKELTPMQTVAKSEEPAQLPARISDLEVERLRVHALQAGQIMVSQLHGQQISSDELECKSGNLVVQNIELPPGLIENIVERVRQTERSQHLTVQTQTSLQNSSESSPVREVLPPPKPPRLRDMETTKPAEVINNTDEQTQTDVVDETVVVASSSSALPATVPPPVMPTVFPTPEYLQSLAPLAFYNLHRAQAELAASEPKAPHRHRHRTRSESPTEGEDVSKEEDSAEELPRRRRTRSTRSTADEDTQSVVKAGSKFVNACGLSLARIINQLADYLRGKEAKEGLEDANDLRSRQVPALVVLFIVITFVVAIFLISGQSVHTHHWDYFNPPGQEGRPS